MQKYFGIKFFLYFFTKKNLPLVYIAHYTISFSFFLYIVYKFTKQNVWTMPIDFRNCKCYSIFCQNKALLFYVYAEDWLSVSTNYRKELTT